MRTLVGAADPPPRRTAVIVSGNSITGSTADTALAFIGATGATVTPWQAVVIHWAYATPTRR
jgi:hypothetical protein